MTLTNTEQRQTLSHSLLRPVKTDMAESPMMAKHPYSILTIFGHCEDIVGDTDTMMPVSFMRTAKRFFDFGDRANNFANPKNRLNQNADLSKTIYQLLDAVDMRMVMPFIHALMDDIGDDWVVTTMDLSGENYDIDSFARILYLDNNGLADSHICQSGFRKAQIIQNLIEGLRMIRHVEWLDGALEKYHPESVMRIGRICMADTVTQMISCAYEMKLAGIDMLWKHVLCGDYTPMAQQYAHIFDKLLTDCQYCEPDAIRLKSMAGAFNAWFSLENLVIDCDHNALDLMDAMMADGVNFGYKSIEPAAVTCLTLQSGGGASYIHQSLVRDIVKSPYYVAVTDSINQTHLMQLVHDMQTVMVGHVSFHDTKLAARFMDGALN